MSEEENGNKGKEYVMVTPGTPLPEGIVTASVPRLTALPNDPSTWSGAYYDESAEKQILLWKALFAGNAEDQSPEARNKVALQRFGIMWAIARNEPNDTQYLWEQELGLCASIILVAAFGKDAAPMLFSRFPSVPRGSMQVGIARALVYLEEGENAISFLMDEMKSKPEKRLDNTALIIAIRKEMEKHGLGAKTGAGLGSLQIDSLGLKRFPTGNPFPRQGIQIPLPKKLAGALA